MKPILSTAALLLTTLAGAQTARWELSAQILPELTKYYGYYSGTTDEQKLSVNPGMGLGVRYRIRSGMFLSAGLAYVPRTFNTTAAFNETAIPGYHGPVNGMEKWTKRIVYRTVSLPLEFNCYTGKPRRVNPFLSGGLSINYLVNASYTTTQASFDGTYAKNEVLGLALTVGGGLDYRLTKRFAALANLRLAGLNIIRNDEFLLGRGEIRPLLHNYCALGLGVTYRL